MSGRKTNRYIHLFARTHTHIHTLTLTLTHSSYRHARASSCTLTRAHFDYSFSRMQAPSPCFQAPAPFDVMVSLSTRSVAAASCLCSFHCFNNRAASSSISAGLSTSILSYLQYTRVSRFVSKRTTTKGLRPQIKSSSSSFLLLCHRFFKILMKRFGEFSTNTQKHNQKKERKDFRSDC